MSNQKNTMGVDSIIALLGAIFLIIVIGSGFINSADHSSLIDYRSPPLETSYTDVEQEIKIYSAPMLNDITESERPLYNYSQAQYDQAEKQLQKQINSYFNKPIITPLYDYKYTPSRAENGDLYNYDNDGDGRTEPVHVNGYYRSNGTYVRGHYRASPR